jgi:TRAP-type C4-dicarboxylate transport system permease small subunit
MPTRISKILAILQKYFSTIHENIALICGAMLFLYMLNIVGDVTGRYLFLFPILGTIEIGENVLAIASFMTLAAVEVRKENMRVTLLHDHVSPKGKILLDIIANLAGIFLMGFMSWQSLLLANRSFHINEVGANFPIPLYIGKYAFFIGCLLLCIQFVYELCFLVYCQVIGGPCNHEIGDNG